jgi:hypothetical protein
MTTTTQLNKVSEIGESLLSEQLEINLISFFDWGLLGVGGFFDVYIPQKGAYGGDQHRLRLSDDKNYTKGRVWEAFRQNWVWETNVEYSRQPIAYSGVYVNGNFHAKSGTGTYEHIVDYVHGRVVFKNPIPVTSAVTAEFSYKYCNVSSADVPWWQTFQRDSFRSDSTEFLQTGSGSWSAQNRVQLPAVIVEAVPRTSRRGKEVGSNVAIVKQDVLFHIVTETRRDLKNIHDIITNQWSKRFNLFDKNALYDNNAFPLNGDGSLTTSPKMYPELTQGYFWKPLIVDDMKSSDNSFKMAGSIRYATVRGTFEVDV